MALTEDAVKALKKTSRTFYIPISRLPAGLQEAVGSAYLCMRAIDEIEDHPNLDRNRKVDLLNFISQVMQAQTALENFARDQIENIFKGYGSTLPEVTQRIGDWACQAPASIAPRIWDATSAMADRMAQWALNEWHIRTEEDLDRYTFSVAGAVGLLICDIGAWFDGTKLNRTHAIQLGRGLQSVNILRNRDEDLRRGIDYFPAGWSLARMHQYARNNLSQAEKYADTLPRLPFSYFIKIPLTLAIATLDALERGEAKLSRTAVLRLVRSV